MTDIIVENAITDIYVEVTGTGGATTMTALTDVDSAGVTDGQVLVYSIATGKWEAASSPTGVTTLAALNDTDTIGVLDGYVLEYKIATGDWTAVAKENAVSGLGDLSDVTITAAATGEVLRYNGAEWIDAQLSFNDLLDTPTHSVVSATGEYTDLLNIPTAFIPSAHTHVKADITDFLDSDYATAAQGTTADSAMQPGDNISELVNDSGYITFAPVDSVAGKTGVVTLVKADITDLNEEDYTKAKISATDTTAGYIIDKVVNGSESGIVMETLNPGADEQLRIALGPHFQGLASTGLYTGGELSVGVTTGTIDISVGEGLHVDAVTAFPTVDVQPVVIAARTNVTITNIAVQPVTYILIDKFDNIIQQATQPTATNLRDYILLGLAVHSDNVNVELVNNLPSVTVDTSAQTHDLMRAFGFFSLDGNIVTANGANLMFNKSFGHAFKEGANFHTNNKDPHTVSLAATVATTFRYRNQNSLEGGDITLLDPTTYDLAGVTTTVPVNSNATIQRIYIFPSGGIRVQRGQTVYANLSAAIDAIGKETFTTESNIEQNGLLIASIAMKKVTTELNDEADAHIFIASRFGELGSVGSSAIGTMQDTYNNSINPEITVEDVGLRGVTVKDSGTNVNRDIIFNVTDAADADVFAVTRDGITFDNTISGLTAVTHKTAIDELASIKLTNVVEDTTPQLGGMLDVNGNSIGDGTLELLTFTETPSAVNQINITNNATGLTPVLGVAGDDADINLCISPKGTGEVVIETGAVIMHTSIEDGDHALEVIFDAAGFGDAKAIEVLYTSGGVVVGQDESVMLVNIDESASTGGEIHGFEVLTTSLGGAKVHGMEVGVNVHPLEQFSGAFADATSILVLAVDQLAALSSGGAGNVTVFAADNNTVTVGSPAQFNEFEFIITTGASGPGISPVFEYSTGVGTWATFTPTDGTNGFKNTGAVLWDNNDLTGWVVGTGAEYLVRITRTKNTLATAPILDLIQIAATIEYSWDKDGVLTIKDLVVSGTVDGRDILIDGVIQDAMAVTVDNHSSKLLNMEFGILIGSVDPGVVGSTGSIAMGANAGGSGDYNIAMGVSATTTGNRAIALGVGTASPGSSATGRSVAIGYAAQVIEQADLSTDGVAIGDIAKAGGGGSIAIGRLASALGSAATGSAIAIGTQAVAQNGCVAIGPRATTTALGQMVLGNDTSWIEFNMDTGSGGGLSLAGPAAQYILPGYATASEPTATEGGVIYDTTVKSLKLYDGTTWQDVSAPAQSNIATVYSGTATTTDATTTAVIGAFVGDDTAGVLTGEITGLESATGDMYWTKIVQGYKNIGGTLSLVGAAVTDTGEDAGAAAWSGVVATDGTKLVLNVTGEAAHTIDWSGRIGSSVGLIEDTTSLAFISMLSGSFFSVGVDSGFAWGYAQPDNGVIDPGDVGGTKTYKLTFTVTNPTATGTIDYGRSNPSGATFTAVSTLPTAPGDDAVFTIEGNQAQLDDELDGTAGTSMTFSEAETYVATVVLDDVTLGQPGVDSQMVNLSAN